jgi:hypothetical protein
MCPACIPSATVVIGAAMSTGGLTAYLVKIFRPKKNVRQADKKTAASQECITETNLATERRPH